MNKISTFLTLSMILFAALLHPQSDVLKKDKGPVFAKVDAIFQEWNRKDSPGCALAIVKDGQIVYQRGYGMADLEHNVAIQTNTIFDIGSVSKQFTAMSMVLLERQGLVSLSEDIRKYLPELQDYGKPITIQHLIYHNSGLRDYLTLMSLRGQRMENKYSEEEILELIARQKELNFNPGEEYLYCNSGYFLMSQIVKRVTGKTLREFAHENIFQPLGMKNTHFHDNFREIVKNRAIGYSPLGKSGFENDMSFFDVTGDGSVMTTVEDLYLWDQNFYNNKLGGGAELIQKLQTTGVLNNGESIDYAFGLRISKHRGLKLISHGGSWVGYRAQILRFPDQHFSVICLANLSTINPSALGQQVADLYLSPLYEPVSESESPDASQTQSSEETAELTLTSEQIEEFSGKYYSEELDFTYELRNSNGKLVYRLPGESSDNVLIAISPDQFETNGLTVVFQRKDQNVVAFLVEAGRVKNIRFSRLKQ